MKEWKVYNSNEWAIDDITSGNYAAFLYLMVFETGEFYIGMKHVYVKVRDAKKIKDKSKESNWKSYTSSSNSVKNMIENGVGYEKYLLWCFPTSNQTALVEAILIGLFGTRHDCVNKAVLCKSRLPKDNGETFKIVQQLIQELQ
ncbi:hypothetical protein ACA373_00150 [Erwinia sp. STN24]|uniref:hypothetical protein n=1 Tax=Erwinia sp. STN24 TaxID=3233996 RepID=UPI00352267A2